MPPAGREENTGAPREVRVRPYATALPLLAVGLLAAGCGGSSPSAGASPKATPALQTVADVVPAMQAAVRKATSVHVAGTVLDGSKQVGLDLSLTTGGASGTVSEGGQTYTILLVATKAHVKVDQDFLKTAGLPAADCSSVCGKYVLVPASQITRLSGSLSMSSFTSGLVKSFGAAAHDTAGRFVAAMLDGQPVLRATSGPYTIDVASKGTPYLVLFSNSKHGGVIFSQWNAVPPLTPPPASQVVSPGGL